MLYMNYKILAGQIEYETTIGYQLSWNNAPLPCWLDIYVKGLGSGLRRKSPASVQAHWSYSIQHANSIICVVYIYFGASLY